ncbi:MAG: hypothetical protein H0X30_22425 [Anaerolineae bacterium]|nr:hypothetical protein [Anaerolineae bacterium]
MNFFICTICIKTADCSRAAATTTCQIGGGGIEGANRCTGGISRANRRTIVSIRRIAPVHPPAISADNVQNLHPFSHLFWAVNCQLITCIELIANRYSGFHVT